MQTALQLSRSCGSTMRNMSASTAGMLRENRMSKGEEPRSSMVERKLLKCELLATFVGLMMQVAELFLPTTVVAEERVHARMYKC